MVMICLKGITTSLLSSTTRI